MWPASASSARELVSKPPMTSTTRKMATIPNTASSLRWSAAAADWPWACRRLVLTTRFATGSAIAILAAPRLAPLTHEQQADPQRRRRVGPPPAEQRVQTDPGQHDHRQIPADGQVLESDAALQQRPACRGCGQAHATVDACCPVSTSLTWRRPSLNTCLTCSSARL